MRILVSGATGFIGRALLTHLAALGHEPMALKRGGPDGAPADLAGIDAWTGWPAGIEAVVHLGALNPARSDPASRDDAALMAANANGTKALARRASAEGVRRFVFASTNLVHAAAETPLDETAPLRPQNAYAASKLAGETGLAQALAGTATRATILRLPPVYGPGGRGGVAALLKLARSPLPLPFAGHAARRSFLSLRNGVDALTVAATSPEAEGTFLVSDGAPWSVGDIVAFARRVEGRPARLVAPPTGLLRLAARASGRQATFDRLYGSFVMDDRRFRTATGWTPPQSVEAGLRETMEGLKDA